RDSSIGCTIRWNRVAASTLLPSPSSPERNCTAADSEAGGRPPLARATSTRSDSALMRIAPSAAAKPSTVYQSGSTPAARQPSQQRRLGEVGADPVEVDARQRGLARPAGQLAVGAVEQQVDLDQ